MILTPKYILHYGAFLVSVIVGLGPWSIPTGRRTGSSRARKISYIFLQACGMIRDWHRGVFVSVDLRYFRAELEKQLT